MLPDPAAAGPAYHGVRTRVTELLAGASAEVAATTVPACPDWTVHQVVSHLTGACLDVLDLNLEGVASDEWTSAQVARFAGVPLDEVLAVWNEAGPRMEEATPLFPKGPAAQLVFDAVTHEHDLRAAIGRPGARDSESVELGVLFLLASLRRSVTDAGLPAFEVTTGSGTWLLGSGEPAATLRASAFELLRSFGGRRSVGQIRSLDWSSDPGPWMGLFANEILQPPADDVLE